MLISPIPAPHVLIIDDDPDISAVIAAALDAVGCRVTTENNSMRAEDACVRSQPDLILVDLMMPGRSGLDLIAPLHQLRPEAIICMTTGLGDPAVLKNSLRSGAWNVLCKPYSLSDLAELVELSIRLTESLRQEVRAGVVDNNLELEFPGDHLPDPADIARLIAVAAAGECDQDVAYRKLPLIATALMDNAHIHGTKECSDLAYGVRLSFNEDALELEVWDNGPGFNGPTVIRQLSTSAPKGKLSGLQLTATLADDVRFAEGRSAIKVRWMNSHRRQESEEQ
ncbi:MAG: response regulator [Calditrichaeota bacterium]|nr:response regulator [Calditrichota bacterium]MCB9366018.1 response regulator [Calditrichota bacterium]MCB9391856.1 response regulator [Calditrichota bacterium]